MSYYGHAFVVATAIYAGTKDQPIVDIDDLCDRLQSAIDKSVFSHDDTKADLYSQLAESLYADTNFENAVTIIENAMESTSRYYRGRL